MDLQYFQDVHVLDCSDGCIVEFLIKRGVSFY